MTGDSSVEDGHTVGSYETIPDGGELLPRLDPFPVPSRVGVFQIEERIAVGGAGIVYRATNTKLHRTVALKLLRDPLEQETALRRFESEARLLAQVRHPSIVTVLSSGALGDFPYIEMEFVEGENLRALLDRREDPARLVELLLPILDAIAHLHEEGIIHRDLKPENILVDPGGTPRLTDFGLARLAWETTRLTRTGQPIGTPSYMSPEQIEALPEGIDHRTDIYSMGVMLYEILTGSQPFRGGTLMEVYGQIRSGRLARPSDVREVSPSLESVCLKAMAHAPDQRYASAAAMAEDIRAARADPEFRAATPRSAPAGGGRPGAGRVGTVLVGLLFVVAGALGFGAWKRSQGRSALESDLAAVGLTVETEAPERLEQQLEALRRRWQRSGQPAAAGKTLRGLEAALVDRRLARAARARLLGKLDVAGRELAAARRLAGGRPDLDQETRLLVQARRREQVTPLLDELAALLAAGKLTDCGALVQRMRRIAPEDQRLLEAAQEVALARRLEAALDGGREGEVLAAVADAPPGGRLGLILLGLLTSEQAQRLATCRRAAAQDPKFGARLFTPPIALQKRRDQLWLALYPDDPRSRLTGLPEADRVRLTGWLDGKADEQSRRSRKLLARKDGPSRKQGLQALGQAIRFAPDRAALRLTRVQWVYAHHRHQPGEPELQVALGDLAHLLKQDPRNRTALFWLGRLHQHMERYPQALDAYQRYLKLAPGDNRVLFRRGVVYRHLQQWERALADLRRVARLDPTSPYGYAQIGYTHYWRRDFAASEAPLRKAIALRAAQRSSAAWEIGRLAKALHRLGRAAEAWELLLPQIDIDARHSDACCGVAIRVGLTLGKRDDVERLAAHLQGKRNKTFEGFHGLAVVAFAKGEHRLALRHARTALEQGAQADADQLELLMGRAWLALGDRRRAGQHAARAARANPKVPGLQALRDALKRKR